MTAGATSTHVQAPTAVCTPTSLEKSPLHELDVDPFMCAISTTAPDALPFFAPAASKSASFTISCPTILDMGYGLEGIFIGCMTA